MAQNCSICQHINKLDMEKAYMNGESINKISQKYDVAYHSLYSHLNNHLSRQLVQAYDLKSKDESFDLMGRMDSLLQKAENIFDRNYKNGKDAMALKALGEQRNLIELLSKISFALHQAKANELEVKRIEAEGVQNEKGQKELQEGMEVLTNAELEMLGKLNCKMLQKDKKTIIIPDNIDNAPPRDNRNNSDNAPPRDNHNHSPNKKPTKFKRRERTKPSNEQPSNSDTEFNTSDKNAHFEGDKVKPLSNEEIPNDDPAVDRKTRATVNAWERTIKQANKKK